MNEGNSSRPSTSEFEMNRDVYRVLVEESNQGIFVLGKKGFEYFNPAFERLLGLSDQEILSQGKEVFRQSIHPDYQLRLIELENYSNDSQISTLPEYINLINKNGQLIEIQFRPVEDHAQRVIGIARDLTGFIESGLRGQEEAAFMLRLIEEASAPIFIIQNGQIKFVNRVVCEVFGYQAEELINTSIEQYLSPQERDKILKKYQERLADKPIKKPLKLKLKHKHGHFIETEIDLNLVNYGSISAEIVIIHDLTERKKIEAWLSDTLKKLKAAFEVTINVLNRVVEIKDPYTGGHQKRVAELAMAIGYEMKISKQQAEGLRLAAQIHDIGKITIPSEILNKPGSLKDSEWELIKDHARIGYELLKDIDLPWPVAEIIYEHHERLNASGYPRCLKEDEIRLEAKILAVADVVEAMSSYRPYRGAYSLDAALKHIEANKGKLYDPQVVEACLSLFREKGYSLNKSSQ